MHHLEINLRFNQSNNLTNLLTYLSLLKVFTPPLSLFLYQDMRSPRFSYNKEEQSKLEIVETLTKCTFPLSNDLVSKGVSFNMCLMFVPC